MVQCCIKFILIYLKQIFLQNKPYQQILLKIKEYCGKWQNLIYFNSFSYFFNVFYYFVFRIIPLDNYQSKHIPISVLHQLDQKIIYPHHDFKHLTEKYFEIGMKLNDFSIQLVKYCIYRFQKTLW